MLLALPPIVAAAAITDSLGRSWDSNKHPRDRKGKFIHTARLIRAFLTPDGTSPWATGEVQQINDDGSIRMKVQKVADQKNNNYIGQMVDIKGDVIENVNEKAKLNMFGKPQQKKAATLGTYDFTPDKVNDFAANAGLPPIDAVGIVKTADELKKSGPTTDRGKYHLALYAKSQSGDGKEHTDGEYMSLLTEMGLDTDVIDDTPDGMSGLKFLADHENSSRSPDINNHDSIDWFNDVPPTDVNAVREAQLRDSDVRVRWYADGTQSIIWPDGTEEQHNKNAGSLLLAAQEAHAAEGTKPDGKANLTPDPEKPVNKVATPGDAPPEPSLEPDPAEPHPSDLEDPTDDELDFPETGESHLPIDAADLHDIADQIDASSAEDAPDLSEYLRSIADSIDDDKLSALEAHVQLQGFADELNDIADDEDDDKLRSLASRIAAEASLLQNVKHEPKADLTPDAVDDFPDDGLDTPEPEAPPAPEPASSGVELTPEELKHVNDYTGKTDQDNPDGQAPDHGDTNEILRLLKDKQEPGGEVKAQTDGLDAVLAKSTLSQDTTVYRGLAFDYDTPEWLNTLKPGTKIKDYGFVSTSRNEDSSKYFTEGEVAGVMLKIDLPAGTHAFDVDADPQTKRGEAELLLPRGTTFSVKSIVKDDADNFYNIEAELVGDDDGSGTPEAAVPAEAKDALPGEDGLDSGPDGPDTAVGDDDTFPAGPAPDADVEADQEEVSEPVESAPKFEVIADTGKSGDGYVNNPDGQTLWGKYGAAGVMIRHTDDDGTERFLLVQRGKMLVGKNQGKWQLPGGALNEKENDYQGSARELTEELSPPDGFLGELTPVGEVNFQHPTGWHYNNIAADSPVQFDPIVDGTETGDAKWFTHEEIKNLPLHPGLANSLDDLFGEFSGPSNDDNSTPDVTPDAPVEEPAVAASLNDFSMSENLTGGEKSALNLYGYSVGYRLINPYLHHDKSVFDTSIMAYRPATPEESVKADEAIKNLDSAFAKATPTDHTVVVYRRTGAELFSDSDMTGETFTNDAYTSTATKLGKHGYGYETKPVLWEVTLPTGTKAMRGNAHENEVLLPRGGKFEVTGDSTEGGVRTLKVTYHSADSNTPEEHEMPLDEGEKEALGLPPGAEEPPAPTPEPEPTPTPTPEPTPTPSAPSSPDEPGPGSTDFEKMFDNTGQYRYHPSGQRIYIGQKVKSQTDGLEGTIVKFEKNHDGAVVLGTDGKKRGRKIKKMDLVSDGPEATPAPAQAPTPTSEQDPAPTPEPTPLAPLDEWEKDLLGQPSVPYNTETSNPWDVELAVNKMGSSFDAGTLGSKHNLTLGDSNVILRNEDGEMLELVDPNGDVVASWSKGSPGVTNGEMTAAVNNLLNEIDAEKSMHFNDEIEMEDLQNGMAENKIMSFMNDPNMGGGDFVELPNGFSLVYSDDMTTVDVMRDGEKFGSWPVDGYGDTFAADDMVQDLQETIQLNSVVSKITPEAEKTPTVGEIRDGIPKNIPGVKKIFPGMSDYQVKQYRNAGFALDDAMATSPSDPAWKKAVEKSIANLTNAGPDGQTKLDEVKKWRDKTLGITSTPSTNTTSATGKPDGTEVFNDGLNWTKDGGLWVSDNGSIAYKNTDKWNALESSSPVAPVSADVPIDTTVDFGSGKWIKGLDGSWINSDGGVAEKGTPAWNTIESEAKLGMAGTAGSDVIPGDPDVPEGSAVYGYYGHNYTKRADGVWTSSTGPAVHPGSPADKDLSQYAKDPSLTPPDTEEAGNNKGKYLTGADNNAIYLGDTVQSTSDGVVGKVISFEKNGSGIVVLGEDGKKRARKAHKMNNISVDAAPYKAAIKMPDTEAPSTTSSKPNPNMAPMAQKHAPDPTSPYFGQPAPEIPKPPAKEEIKYVDDAWMQTAAENYKTRRLTQNPDWVEKPFVDSYAYKEYVAVQSGDKATLGNLLGAGRITQDMYDDALKQIDGNTAQIFEKQQVHTEELKKWREEQKAWRKANGMPMVELRGMDDGVLKMSVQEAKTWMTENQRAGTLGPGGKLSAGAKQAVSAQKSTNQSYGLRQLREKSLDPAEVNYLSNSETVKGLDQAMLESPPVKQDFITVRTFNTDALMNPDTGKPHTSYAQNLSNIVGSIQHDWGFAETSPNALDAGGKPGYTIGTVVMELRVPKGTRGVWTLTPGYNFGAESERGFILERGVAYYIHSAEYKTGGVFGSGKWHVKAELIPKTEVNYDEFGHFVNQNPFFD